MRGNAAETKISTHNLQELGVEVPTLEEVDNLGIDVHTELSAKRYHISIRSILI
jgi:hypothetical protein